MNLRLRRSRNVEKALADAPTIPTSRTGGVTSPLVSVTTFPDKYPSASRPLHYAYL